MAGSLNSGGRRGRRRPMADINVTPMVDVMLVLLVVFMITAPMLATGVAVNLPKTRAEQLPTEKERPLVVTIDKNGKYYVGMEDKPVEELAQLATMLKAIAGQKMDKRVYVRADEAVPYGKVMTVLTLLQRAGFTNAGLPVDSKDARAMDELLKEGGKTPEMRLSVIPSLALHIGAVAIFLPMVSNAWKADSAPMIILPVELLEIDDTTNMTAAAEAPKEEPKEEPEAPPVPAQAAPPPPPPEPEEEILPTKEAPPPPKEEKKKEEKKPEKLDVDTTLKDLLAAARSAPAPAPAKKSAPDPTATSEGATRMSVGDRRRMTMTVADAILQQLISRGCWNNQADMADARRLRAVIAVRFGRDGHFSVEPRLIEPSREPSGDQPLQVYIQRARNGLSKCNQLGFQVPEQYFEVQPPQTIELDFRPCPNGTC